jgi:hypothetical protein
MPMSLATLVDFWVSVSTVDNWGHLNQGFGHERVRYKRGWASDEEDHENYCLG